MLLIKIKILMILLKNVAVQFLWTNFELIICFAIIHPPY